MGIGGIGIWQLLIVLVIIILLFGTKKLRNVGADLGGAIKNFRKATREGEGEGAESAQAVQEKLATKGEEDVIEGEVTAKETTKEKDKV